MKKLSYLVIILIGVFVSSCSYDEDNNLINVEEIKTSQLSPQQQEIENKIEEIILFKQNQEAEIVEKILSSKRLRMPTEIEMQALQKGTPDSDLSEINPEVIKKDLEFYHTERLKAIYSLRETFGFTSIQSIADEIESLKLLDPAKAKRIFDSNSKHLVKQHDITSTIYNKGLSEIINGEGEVWFDGEVPRSILDNMKLADNKNRNNCTIFTEGVVGIVAGPPYIAMSYHAGIGVYGARFDQYFTQLGLYIVLNGQPILYPSFVNGNVSGNPSFVKFKRLDGASGRTVLFPQGYGSVLRYISESYLELHIATYCVDFGSVHANLATPIGSSYVYSTGYVYFDL